MDGKLYSTLLPKNLEHKKQEDLIFQKMLLTLSLREPHKLAVMA